MENLNLPSDFPNLSNQSKANQNIHYKNFILQNYLARVHQNYNCILYPAFFPPYYQYQPPCPVNIMSNQEKITSPSSYFLYEKNEEISNQVKKEDEKMPNFNEKNPKKRDIQHIKLNTKKNLNKLKKIIKKKKKKSIKDLALRNIRSNFASNVIKFIKFLIEFKNKELGQEYKDIYYWLIKNSKTMNSYEGWRKLWNEEKYGVRFRKICKLYFRKSFAISYIETSRIKQEYKDYYYDWIKNFAKAASNPNDFVSIKNIV